MTSRAIPLRPTWDENHLCPVHPRRPPMPPAAQSLRGSRRGHQTVWGCPSAGVPVTPMY